MSQAMSIKSYVHNYRRYIALIIVDVLFFGLTSPNSSSFVIIPAFTLVIINILAITDLLMRYFMQIIPIKDAIRRRVTVVVSVTIALIVALQSIGQLTLRDVVTIVPLAGLLYFYMSYMSRRVPRR